MISSGPTRQRVPLRHFISLGLHSLVHKREDKVLHGSFSDLKVPMNTWQLGTDAAGKVQLSGGEARNTH